jgi:hypothetical protein
MAVEQMQKTENIGHPKQGEKFHCKICGMAIQVTADCRCKDEDGAHFRCCNQEMQRT